MLSCIDLACLWKIGATLTVQEAVNLSRLEFCTCASLANRSAFKRAVFSRMARAWPHIRLSLCDRAACAAPAGSFVLPVVERHLKSSMYLAWQSFPQVGCLPDARLISAAPHHKQYSRDYIGRNQLRLEIALNLSVNLKQYRYGDHARHAQANRVPKGFSGGPAYRFVGSGQHPRPTNPLS